MSNGAEVLGHIAYVVFSHRSNVPLGLSTALLGNITRGTEESRESAKIR